MMSIFTGSEFVLMKDLDFKNVTNFAAMDFNGSLDGNHFNVMNLNIFTPNYNGDVAIFNSVNNATLKNLHFLNVSVLNSATSSFKISVLALKVENLYLQNVSFLNCSLQAGGPLFESGFLAASASNFIM